MATTSSRRSRRARSARWRLRPAPPGGSRSSPISPDSPPAATRTVTSLSRSRSILRPLRKRIPIGSIGMRSRFFDFAHVLVGKPVPTFPGHALALAVALLATPAYAHGFGQRYDLPIPLSFYLVGTAAAVVLS